MKERAQNIVYTPSTQMDKIFDLGNTIWEKNQWEGEAYALLSFI
jgi:hypothetical protein